MMHRRHNKYLIIFCLIGVFACSSTPDSTSEPEFLSAGLLPLPALDLQSIPEEIRAEVQLLEKEAQSALKPGGTKGKRAEAFGEYAKACLALEKTELAEASLSNARVLDPTNFEWKYLSGHMAREGGDQEGALRYFQQAVELNPESVAALAWLARTLIDRGEPEDLQRATIVLDRLLEVEPQSAVAQHQLGRIALEERRYDEAVTHLKTVLERIPSANIVHYPLALAYRGLGARTEAAYHLEQRGETDLYPDDPIMESVRNRFDMTASDLDRAARLMSAERWPEANEAYQSILTREPTSTSARLGLGISELLNDRVQQADDYFKEVLVINPSHGPALYGRGVVAEKLNQPSNAMDFYQRVLDLNADFQRALTRVGELHRQQASHQAAIEAYTKALAGDDLDAVAHLGRILSSTLLGDLTTAKEYALQASNKLPEQPAFLHMRARFLVCNPQPSSAAEIAEASQALKSLESTFAQSSDFAETIAMLFARTGKFDEAVTWQHRTVRSLGADSTRKQIAQERLNLYQQQQPCVSPFPATDPIHATRSEPLPPPLPRKTS